jgi:MFS transporter, PAT family, beta-lactamase induction signal transducer AmpG
MAAPVAAPAPPSSPDHDGGFAPKPPREADPALPVEVGRVEGPSLGERVAAAPWVLSTYFAEGLPFSIVRQLSSEFFTSLGADPKQIGATSLYGLAWNLKLFWSPLLDRHGTLRRWLLAAQALLGLAVMAAAWPAGQRDLGGVARVLVVVAFLAATHDVAIDGFYLEALDTRGQAELSGLRVAAYRVALLVGKALLALAGALQLAGWDRAAAWRATFVAAGASLVLLAGAHALVLPRPPSRRGLGAPAPRYAEAFVSFLAQPSALVSLLFIVLYKAGDALMFAMNAPFLRSLGFGDMLRGALGTAAMIASITGSIASGAAIARYGLRRMLAPIAAVQSLAILMYVALAAARPGAPVVAAVAVVEQLAGGVGDSALAVFLMRRCLKEHKAAHFAIGSALMSLASTAAGVSSGYLVQPLGYPVFFALAFAASLPGVALAFFVPKE